MQAGLDFLRGLQPNGAGRRIFVCGEMRDLGPEGNELHAELGRAIDVAVAEVLITVGDLTVETAQAAEGNGHAPHVIACADVDEAAAAVKAQARPGDIVYLKASRSVGLEKVLESF